MDVTMATRFTSADFHGVDDVEGAVGEHGLADVLGLAAEGHDDAGDVGGDDLRDVRGVGHVALDDGEVGVDDGLALGGSARAGGWASFEGVRASTVTLAPRLSAWTTHSEPVPPVPPKTTTWDLSAGVAEANAERARTTREEDILRARRPREVGATARAPIAEEESVEAADIGTVPGNARVA